MGQYDLVSGPVLIATWVNTIFFTLQCTMAVRYFRTHKRDTAVRKAMVSFSLMLDLVCSATVCANVYLFCVSGWGDTSVLLYDNWTYPVSHLVSGVNGFLVQSFLIRRYARLSRQMIVSILFECGSIVGLIGAILATATFIKYPHVNERDKLRIPAIMWFAMSLGVDLAVAGALVFELFRAKTNFKDTRSLIHRIIVRAISTGFIIAVWSGLILVTYFIWPFNNVSSFFSFCFGRLYGLTLLCSLNARHEETSQGSGPNTLSSAEPCSCVALKRRGTHTQLQTLNVQIQRVVHIDTGRGASPVDIPDATDYSDAESARDKSTAV